MRLSFLISFFLKFFLIPLSFLIIFSACGNDDVDVDNNINSNLTVQFSNKALFNNELSGRLITPDYQISLFSDTSESVNYIKSILYKTTDTQLVIYRGEGANENRNLVFPIENNKISPFGYELIITKAAVTQVNIIEKNSESGSYTILANLYNSSGQNPQAPAQINKQYKDSSNQEKTLEEEYKEVTEVLASPFLNLFGISWAEIQRKLNELPSDIQNKLGNWNNNQKDLDQNTKDAITAMLEAKENLDTAREEPLDEDLDEEENIIKEDISTMKVEPENLNNGFYMSTIFYPLVKGFIDYACDEDNGCSDEDFQQETYSHEMEISSREYTISYEDGEPYLSDADYALVFEFASNSYNSLPNGQYKFRFDPNSNYTFYGYLAYDIQNGWEKYTEVKMTAGKIQVYNENGELILIFNEIELETGEVLSGRHRGIFLDAAI